MKQPEIQKDKDITSLTTFDIPVKARLFAEYSSVAELTRLWRSEEFRENEIFQMGGGSNLLFLNDFNGLVLHSRILGIKEYRKDDENVFVIAGAGEKWTDFVDYCVDNGLGGLENLAYIPGEVGASAIQNVGAYGVEAGDYIHAVECFDITTGKTITIRREECGYGYRTSRFKEEWKGRYIVLRVSFHLHNQCGARHLNYGPLRTLAERLGHQPSIKEVRDEVVRIRREKLPDPKETGSAGSFFKNPVVDENFYTKILRKKFPDMPSYPAGDGLVKLPAAWLIEHSGLKGAAEGGARIYDKQCLVIVNDGAATAKDVVSLSNLVKRRVRRKFAVSLKPEVNFIDISLDAVFLGTGTSKGVPEVGCDCDVCRSDDSRDKRLRSSLLIRTHGLEILIDPSPDLRTQMLREDVTDLDAVLVTHTHYDHLGGIDDLRVFTGNHPLPLYMKSDVAADLHRRLDYCFRENAYPGVPSLDIHDISDRTFVINGLEIQPIPVLHGKMEIVGYRIGKFAYITDASYIPDESMWMLEGLDILVLNSLRKTPHFAHFSLEQSLEVIKRLQPREAYLTHLCHEMGKHADVEKDLPENVHFAYDGLRLHVK